MRKYRTFYRSITTSENPVKIRWGGYPSKSESKHRIVNVKMGNMHKILGDADHPKTQKIIKTGTIQEICLIDKTLQFVPFKKTSSKIKLNFSENLANVLKHLLGEQVKIKYNIVTAYNNDKVATTKELLGLENIS